MKNLGIFLLILFIGIPLGQAISITMHIPEEYNSIQGGERLHYEVDVKYPENPVGNRKDVTFNIKIIANEEVIAESKLLKAIETQLSFTDYILVPDNAPTGKATINVQVEDFNALSEDVQTTFYITSASENEFKNYFHILLSTIIIIGAAIMAEVFYFRKRRK